MGISVSSKGKNAHVLLSSSLGSFLCRLTLAPDLPLSCHEHEEKSKMQKSIKTAGIPLAALSFMILIQGCAHTQFDRHIDDQLAQERDVKTRADLHLEGATAIQTASGLDDVQRQKLTDLRIKTVEQLDPLWERSLKLREVLVRDLISTPYDEDEVELIKVRLKKISDQRLTIMFDAVKQANLILGRQAKKNEEMIDVLFDSHVNRN